MNAGRRARAARAADRPELQRLMPALSDRPGEFVIVHTIDRLARNRADDVALTAAILATGAQLVSVTENIDETPSGHLLHGIMSSIAEVDSGDLATEVSKGTQQKVRAGGTPNSCPVGYRNVRNSVGGVERRTVPSTRGARHTSPGRSRPAPPEARRGVELAQLEERVHAVQRERFAWAEKAMAGVVPDDIAVAQQQRLARQLSSAETELLTKRALLDIDRSTLDRCFAILSDAGLVYRGAKPSLRRAMNGAWFHLLVITEDGADQVVAAAVHENLTGAVQTVLNSRRAPTSDEALGNSQRRRLDADGVPEVRVRTMHVWWS